MLGSSPTPAATTKGVAHINYGIPDGYRLLHQQLVDADPYIDPERLSMSACYLYMPPGELPRPVQIVGYTNQGPTGGEEFYIRTILPGGELSTLSESVVPNYFKRDTYGMGCRALTGSQRTELIRRRAALCRQQRTRKTAGSHHRRMRVELEMRESDGLGGVV